MAEVYEIIAGVVETAVGNNVKVYPDDAEQDPNIPLVIYDYAAIPRLENGGFDAASDVLLYEFTFSVYALTVASRNLIESQIVGALSYYRNMPHIQGVFWTARNKIDTNNTGYGGELLFEVNYVA